MEKKKQDLEAAKVKRYKIEYQECKKEYEKHLEEVEYLKSINVLSQTYKPVAFTMEPPND